MKLLAIATCVLASTVSAQVNIGGYSFHPGAFPDAAALVSGNPASLVTNFPTTGSAAGDILLASNAPETTYIFSADPNYKISLHFEDNILFNGPGADLVIFELGLADSAAVVVDVMGLPSGPIVYTTSFTGSTVLGFDLNAVAIDLSDFGSVEGEYFNMIQMTTPVSPNSGTIMSFSALGCLNSIVVCDQSPECRGDPHFKTWSGEWFDYHGSCDLIFLSSKEFADATGMDLHIRTTKRYSYSYIESAALKIGDDILEVSSFGSYMLNGVSGATMPALLAGYPVTYTQVNEKKHEFVVDLGEATVEIGSFKDLVSVKLGGDPAKVGLHTSIGMLGEYKTGALLGRNGTLISDPNEFGQEWQVRDTESKLFQTNRSPQFPEKCVMPTDTSTSRRLGSSIAAEAAEKVCEHWGDLKDQCVFDVMAANDVELAGAF